jgi:hypothetical protein
MADVYDVPGDIRNLARVIPPLTRALMEPVELRLRCEFAAELIGIAALADDAEASQLKRKARKHLEAMSLAALNRAIARLNEKAREADLNNDERTAAGYRDEAADLFRRHPQLPEEWLRSVQLSGLAGIVTAKRPWLQIFRKKQ